MEIMRNGTRGTRVQCQTQWKMVKANLKKNMIEFKKYIYKNRKANRSITIRRKKYMTKS